MGLDIPATSGWAFDAYEAVRERLPPMGAGGACAQVSDLEAIAHDFDVILLDGFGVLNVGESAIPGALGRIQSLRKAGKTLLVVTNAAGYPKRFLLERYRRIGFDFALANIVSSREAMLLALRAQPERLWGVMAEERYGDEELDWCRTRILGDALADYDAVGGFLLLGSGSWTGERQQFLETSLARHPRPVLVGNPDIVAPRENGLSREPGYFAHRVADRTDTQPAFFGKPFSGVFDLARKRFPEGIDASRVLMVGDTLHTDILGGQAAGMQTALVTGFGSLVDMDPIRAIEHSGLRPDFIMQKI